jgi:ABC-2 type transport system permease protein
VTTDALSSTLPWPPAGAVLTVYRAERRKLLAQVSTRVLALVCALAPLAFAVIVSGQSGVPSDSLLGVWVHSSGYAVSFVVLGFAGMVGFAIVAGLLAGDLFSSEDRYGTWKTVLTRSRTRADVFAGKALAAAVLSLVLLALIAVSSLVSGLLVTGDQSLVGLGGNLMSSSESLWLLLASWLLSVPPMLAFTSLAVLFSVATRNGIVGVLGPVLAGLIMQLLASVGTGTWVHLLLVSSAFDDWHGLLAAPKFYGPLIIGTCVCVVWVAGCLGASWALLRRRDFAGPPVSRRAGWVMPARAVLSAAVLIVVLAAAGSLGPAAVTKARLEASIAPVFNKLTVLQQQELGRVVPQGTRLRFLTTCTRRSSKKQGPGDDWSCTLSVVTTKASANPEVTPVTYEVGVKSNGCYKAQAPPSFVGQQMLADAHGRSIVNPLFTIYGCFDVTRAAPRCPESGHCPETVKPPTGGSTATSRTSTPPSPAERLKEERALHEAERKAGPKVLREQEESEKQLLREAQHPPPEERTPEFHK